MLDKVIKTLHTYQMLSKGDSVVVGISGGADSVALLHILCRLRDTMGFTVTGAHINHGMRGADSDGDAVFAERLCKDYDVPFHLKSVDIRQLSRQWGYSEEECGRVIRYSFFHELLQQTNSQKIATAHHKNDQAETIMQHLIRGTGVQGLGGMKPVRDGRLIRPLLNVSREEIEDYINENHLDFRVDASNAQTNYTRNHIRHCLIPFIEEEYNPLFVDALCRMSTILRDEDDYMEGICSALFQKHVMMEKERIRIPLDPFFSWHTAVRSRMIRLGLGKLKEGISGIGQKHVMDVTALVENASVGSMIQLPGGLCARKDYEDVVLEYIQNEVEGIPPYEEQLQVPGTTFLALLHISITAMRVSEYDSTVPCSDCIHIDAGKITGPLTIRQRRSGDRFQPLGVNGSKKLKDYMIDRKIPREERDRIPLVVDTHNIIWVTGYQIHNNYRVTADTKDILKLQYHLESEDYHA